jgi:hypothetical protein
VPIPEGKHGNKADSSNVRGITLSSIYGKLFDNVVLFRDDGDIACCRQNYRLVSE